MAAHAPRVYLETEIATEVDEVIPQPTVLGTAVGAHAQAGVIVLREIPAVPASKPKRQDCRVRDDQRQIDLEGQGQAGRLAVQSNSP